MLVVVFDCRRGVANLFVGLFYLSVMAIVALDHANLPCLALPKPDYHWPGLQSARVKRLPALAMTRLPRQLLPCHCFTFESVLRASPLTAQACCLSARAVGWLQSATSLYFSVLPCRGVCLLPSHGQRKGEREKEGGGVCFVQSSPVGHASLVPLPRRTFRAIAIALGQATPTEPLLLEPAPTYYLGGPLTRLRPVPASWAPCLWSLGFSRCALSLFLSFSFIFLCRSNF
jgi:hypothetical protein